MQVYPFPRAVFQQHDFRRAPRRSPLRRPTLHADQTRKPTCLHTSVPEYSRQRPHIDHCHIPKEEILVKGSGILTWETGFFIHFSSFHDQFVLNCWVFLWYGVQNNENSISGSHLLTAASRPHWPASPFAEGLLKDETGGLYWSFQKSHQCRGQWAKPHSFVSINIQLCWWSSCTNLGLFPFWNTYNFISCALKYIIHRGYLSHLIPIVQFI